jgi:hypothetical protein
MGRPAAVLRRIVQKLAVHTDRIDH